MVLAVALFWVLVFALNRLYSVRRWPVRQEVVGVIYAVSTGMMLVFTVIFFRREIFESRFIVLVAWGLAMAFVILARLFLRLAHRWLVSRGFGQHRVILIGPEEEAAPLVNEFKRKPGLGFRHGRASGRHARNVELDSAAEDARRRGRSHLGSSTCAPAGVADLMTFANKITSTFLHRRIV